MRRGYTLQTCDMFLGANLYFPISFHTIIPRDQLIDSIRPGALARDLKNVYSKSYKG